jgi:MerR family Zn(II)-responsive transcriptional regulator of zntA
VSFLRDFTILKSEQPSKNNSDKSLDLGLNPKVYTHPIILVKALLNKKVSMYRIGELAASCEIKADTLRFYEKHGLLTPSSRSDSGYRLYSEQDKAKLSFIIRAKAVGFTLNEIAELLSIEVDKSNRVCADVKGMVDLKLEQVQAKIKELSCFASSLQSLSNACCGGPESAEHCSILEALESTSKDLNPKQEHGHKHTHTHNTGAHASAQQPNSHKQES